jgi:hypothetical protein
VTNTRIIDFCFVDTNIGCFGQQDLSKSAFDLAESVKTKMLRIENPAQSDRKRRERVITPVLMEGSAIRQNMKSSSP